MTVLTLAISTHSNHRKSVTFTPDTKAADGFSAQRFFKDWAANNSTVSEAAQPSTELDAAQASPSSKKPKQSKEDKEKAKSAESAPDPEEPTKSTALEKNEAVPEYVHYVEQFHSDKANWKFSKKKQKDLLKNLFNIYRIPSRYDSAIIAYIRGLQGSGARQRVLEDSENILKARLKAQSREDEIEGMGSRAERKAAYEAALRRDIEIVEQTGRSQYDDEKLEEMRREVERIKRAEALLAELLPKELASLSATSTPAATAPLPKPSGSHITFSDDETSTPPPSKTSTPNTKITKRKKRKSRTEVSSDESSSSDSSSESEGE
jgi:hypothetical protein